MDEATYTAISERYLSSFFRTAYSLLRNKSDAEDAVQQALLNVWKARTSVRAGSERAFMTRVVINECRNIQRKRMRGFPSGELDETESYLPPEDIGLYDMIRSLPDSLRTPFLLKYMEEMTAKEIAEAMRLPLASVKNRLFRARKKLQKKMDEEAAKE